MTETQIVNDTELLSPDSVAPRRSLRAAEYLAVKDQLPRSQLSKAILNINVCEERKLELQLKKFNARQQQYNNNADLQQRAFHEQQNKKHRTWKFRDDCVFASMNFPNLPPKKESNRKDSSNPRTNNGRLDLQPIVNGKHDHNMSSIKVRLRPKMIYELHQNITGRPVDDGTNTKNPKPRNIADNDNIKQHTSTILTTEKGQALEIDDKQSMDVLYTSPPYQGIDVISTPLKPYQRLERSRTEIIQNNHDLYTSRLPKVIKTSQPKLERYNTYCDQDLINRSLKDPRFTAIGELLQPGKMACERWGWLGRKKGQFRSGIRNVLDLIKVPNSNISKFAKSRSQVRVVFPSVQPHNSTEALTSGLSSLQKSNTRPARVPHKSTEGQKDKHTLVNKVKITLNDEEIQHQQKDADGGRHFESPTHKRPFRVKSSIIQQ